MPRTRIYQARPLQVHDVIELDENASHHLARVLRAAVDEAIVLFNGQGGEYVATIQRIDKKKVTVVITAFHAHDVESPLELHLAQGIARGEKMDFIIQKAVELGVTRLFPLLTERCNVRLDPAREEKRLQHWRAILISACEQCGRNRLPDIQPPTTLDQWLQQNTAAVNFTLSPHAQEKLPDLAIPSGAISLLIGPEGGLSDNEIHLSQQRGFLTLNLGPRILRTETATLAAITALQCRYGDMY